MSAQPDPAERRGIQLTRAKLYGAVAVAVVLIACLFGLASFGLQTMSGVRAFVGGEGLWAKHQKDMTHHVLLYLDTGDEAHWGHYQEHLEALRTATLARVELDKPDPDMAVVTRGFGAVGIPARDVEAMAKLFRRFRTIDHVDHTVRVWAMADGQVEAFHGLAAELRRLDAAGELHGDRRARALVRLDEQQDRLRALEEEFSATLGTASHWARGLLVTLMGVLSLIAVGLSLALGWFGARAINRDKRHSQRLQHQTWLKSAQTKLSERLSGQLDVAAVAGRAIRQLSKQLSAQVGAFYVAESDGSLRLAGSYAAGKRKGIGKVFQPGEGLVGQAAIEREPIVAAVPEDHVRVRSGTGQSPPTSVLLYPLLLDDEVKGVVELASTQALDERARELLEAADGAVAHALHGAQARSQVQELLEQTRAQNEELQTQEEELRQANEELEEHSEALQESQRRLETQQQRLEEANAELEERAESLERQQRAIEAQNTELEETREAMAEKARALEEASRYKSEFLANMSHELRTPLNSIIILSGLLAENREGSLSDKQVAFARTVNESGTDLLELINELLDLSKIEAGKMTLVVDEVDLDGFLAGVNRQFAAVAEEKQLAFVTQRGDDVPARIHSDSQRLGQIVKNLLSNAFKFTEEGTVRLTLERPSDADWKECTIASAPRDEFFALTVDDTGIGIAEDKQRLIFQAFQQGDGATDRKYGGTGLGLAITRQFVRLLGGRIVMRSAPGKGTSFTIVLPVQASVPADGSTALVSVPPVSAPPLSGSGTARSSVRTAVVAELTPPEVEAAEAEEPPAEPAPPSSVRDDRDTLAPEDRSILVIEDDPRFARTLADLARERGYKVLVAEDGQAGMDAARRYDPSAILLDLVLPDVDGMVVMNELKEDLKTRHIPVHVISGLGKKLETLKAGAFGFLQKPVSLAQLDAAFGKIEGLLSKPVKSLLVVVADEVDREAIVELIAEKDVEIVSAATAEQALATLAERSFDCVVLDLAAPASGSVDLLRQVRRSDGFSDTPVVALTRGDLSGDDQLWLDRYADRVVVKGDKLPARLLDETALFLHRVNHDLPEDKRELIQMMHDKEAILQGRKVLLVDDDMRNVFALSSVLEDKGMDIVVARHGKEALARLDEHPDVDLVLMDIMMPEMDGYEATRAIRKLNGFAKLPIIALTAKAMKGDRAKCLEAGASDYLAKPVDTGKLLSVLRVWLYQ